MARRIWIISEKAQVEQADIDDADANNCPEIVNGIPPKLIGEISQDMLPCAYEEPSADRMYRYELFSSELIHEKLLNPILVGYEIVEFKEELSEQEIQLIQGELGKTIRRIR